MWNSKHREFSQGYTARSWSRDPTSRNELHSLSNSFTWHAGLLPTGACTFPMFSLINMEQARRKLFKTQQWELPGSLTSSEQHLDSQTTGQYARALSMLSPKKQPILTLMFPDSGRDSTLLSHGALFPLPNPSLLIAVSASSCFTCWMFAEDFKTVPLHLRLFT